MIGAYLYYILIIKIQLLCKYLLNVLSEITTNSIRGLHAKNNNNNHHNIILCSNRSILVIIQQLLAISDQTKHLVTYL